MPKLIKLKEIDDKSSPPVRDELRMEVCLEYVEQYRSKKHGMPMPILFEVKPGHYLIGDGHHRIESMRMAGIESALFDVRPGNYQDCVKFALRSNIHHGIRRSQADKRQCVSTALKEFNTLSNRALAELCEVGDDLVSEVRKDMEKEGAIPKVDKRVAKDGRTLDAGTAPAKPSTKGNGEVKSKGDVAAPAALPPEGVSETRDATGHPIPPKAMGYWKRRQEPAALLAVLSQIKSELNEANKNKDLLWCEVNFNAVEADLERVYAGLKVAVPHAVCPACQGQLVDTCKFCRGRGVVSKFKYDQAPTELKKIREAKK